MNDLFRNADDLGEYLFRIVDNGGETADRYTVLFSDGDALCLSDNPGAPWGGVSLWAERVDPAALESWISEGAAVDLGWHDLPEAIRAHVLAHLNEAWRDYPAAVEARDPVAVAESRDAATDNERTHTSAGVDIYHERGRYFVRLDGDQADDRGPFTTTAEALRASLPDHYGLAGPEYHSPRLDGAAGDAGEPCPEVAAAVAALEVRREAEHAGSATGAGAEHAGSATGAGAERGAGCSG